MIWKIISATLIGMILLSTFTAESTKEIKYEITKSYSHERQEVSLTWYTSTVDQCDDTPWITADGTRVRSGIIAVSPDMLGTFAFGDSVFVVNHGWFEIHDVMNRRWKNRIDIWVKYKSEIPVCGIEQTEIWWDFKTEERYEEK